MRSEGFRRILNGAEKFRTVLAAAGCILLLVPIVLTGQTPPGDPLRPVAERYVRLVLAVGQHDGDYVDAFYGPPEWRKEAEASKLPLATIDQQAADLAADFVKTSATAPVARDAELWALRRQYLERQLSALRAKVALLQGKKMTFDDESRALYDAVAPTHTEADFDLVLKELDAKLPGTGSLIERYVASDRIRDPAGPRRSRVQGCHPRLPRAHARPHRCCRPTEKFTVEYVTNKSWSGYNWYQGTTRA